METNETIDRRGEPETDSGSPPVLYGFPDLTQARKDSCPCGAVNLYVDNQVTSGFADITFHCGLCDTWIALSPSARNREDWI